MLDVRVITKFRGRVKLRCVNWITVNWITPVFSSWFWVRSFAKPDVWDGTLTSVS